MTSVKELQELVAQMERFGCCCDLRNGYTCGIHAIGKTLLAELAAVIAKMKAPSPERTELEQETRKLIAAHDFIVSGDDTAGKRLNFWVGRCEILLNLLVEAPASQPGLSLESAITIAEEFVKQYQSLQKGGYTHWNKANMGRLIQAGVNAALALAVPQREPVNASYESATGEGFDFQYRPPAPEPSNVPQAVVVDARKSGSLNKPVASANPQGSGTSIHESGYDPDLAMAFDTVEAPAAAPAEAPVSQPGLSEAQVRNFIAGAFSPTAPPVPEPSAKVEVCGICGDFLAGDYCATCDAHVDEDARDLAPASAKREADESLRLATVNAEGDAVGTGGMDNLPLSVKTVPSSQTIASGMMYDLAMQSERESKQRDRDLIRKGLKAGLEEAAQHYPNELGNIAYCRCGWSGQNWSEHIRAIDIEALAARIEKGETK